MSEEPTPSFSFARKWSQRINVMVGIGSLLAIVMMANYLASRHYQRFHLRANDRTRLTHTTQRLLGALTNEIKVVCYFSRDDTLYGDVRELLSEYRSVTSRITLELVDSLRDPGGAEAVKTRYGLSAAEKSFVMFDANGRTKLIRQGDLFDYDMQPLISGQSKEVKRKDFKGELLFTSAIYYVTTQRSSKAYFIIGHGERSPDDKENVSGVSKLASMLQSSGVEWATLEMIGAQAVPDDCSLLIIAGPQNRWPPQPLASIQRYLENGGRALILFDAYGLKAETGLEAMLERFGVRVGFDTLKDTQTNVGTDIVVSEFGNHPITKALSSSGTQRLQVVLPRSITPIPRAGGAADSVRVDPLFTTTAQGMLIEPQRSRGGSPTASSVRTNYPMAVAVELGGLAMVDAARAGTCRLVVLGDAMFLDNEMFGAAANALFAGYAVNWLLDRSMLLSDIGPQPYHEFSLSMTQSDRTLLNWLFLLGLPGTALAMGFFVWLRRRS